jgi:hypothetical protein
LNSETLVTAGEDCHVRCFRIADGALQADALHDNFATDVLALTDGRYASSSYDGTIALHERADQQR